MSVPLLNALRFVTISLLCLGHSIRGFRSTDMVTTTKDQLVSTASRGDWFSTEQVANLGNRYKEQPQVISLGESQETKFETQLEETTVSPHSSQGEVENPFDPNACNMTKGVFDQLQGNPDHLSAVFQQGYNTTTCAFRNSLNKSASKDEEDQLVSSATVSTVRVITQEVIVPVLAFPGCVFNIISIYVLVKQGTESSSTRYLIALGVADLSYLVISILNWIVVLLNEYQYPSYVSLRLALRYQWVSRYFILLTGRYSNALVLLFSLDRFIAVKSPLKAKTSPLSRHPVKFAFAVFVFIALLIIPNLFRAEFIELTNPDKEQSELVYRWTPFAVSNPGFYRVYTYIILVTLRLFPVVFTFFLNAAIVVVVKLSTSSRVTKHVTDEKRQQKELKITRVLLTISLIFLICVTPGLVHALISNFFPAFSRLGTNQNLYLVFLYIYPVLDAINSTVNFFIYVLFSEKFRVVFLGAFCPRFTTESDTETREEQMSS